MLSAAIHVPFRTPGGALLSLLINQPDADDQRAVSRMSPD
jgi:hypothetical protein